MRGRLIAREQLDAAARARMFELLGQWFEGVTEERFLADLEEKNWVIWLEDDDGRLVGFSTLVLYPWRNGGEPLSIVYSGDTIVAPEAWQSPVLARTWIESVVSLHRTNGGGRLLWLLITSGFRTYRFLPTFFREFYPCHDRPTPEATQRMLDELAQERFGDRYDRASGVVRFEHPQILNPSLRGIPEGRLRDPHVAFFARANAGHAGGDELVSLTEIARDNLTAAGRRVASAAFGPATAAPA